VVVVCESRLDASALTSAIQALTAEGNGTPTSDAIDAAVTYLTATNALDTDDCG
jgi:hypothetical protein